MQSTRDQPILFLGAGLMGKPMIQTLARQGTRVCVWNRTSINAKDCQAERVQVFDQLSDAVNAFQAAKGQIVISMLADGDVVISVLSRAIEYGLRDTHWIDMSSTRPDQARFCASIAECAHINFSDAPVSGGVLAAQNGTLAIMVGCHQSVWECIQSPLTDLGRPIRVGAVGCGQVAKLCNQLIVGGTISIVAEALTLAHAGGADPSKVREAIRGGFAESRVLEVHGARMLSGDFKPGGKVSTQLKDLSNVLQCAQESDLTLPITTHVFELFSALAKRLPDADHAAAFLEIEHLQKHRT